MPRKPSVPGTSTPYVRERSPAPHVLDAITPFVMVELPVSQATHTTLPTLTVTQYNPCCHPPPRVPMGARLATPSSRPNLLPRAMANKQQLLPTTSKPTAAAKPPTASQPRPPVTPVSPVRARRVTRVTPSSRGRATGSRRPGMRRRVRVLRCRSTCLPPTLQRPRLDRRGTETQR